MENKEKKQIKSKKSKSATEKKEEPKVIHLGSPAFHPDEIKAWFVALLTSMIKYLEMNKAIYNEDNDAYIEDCKQRIAAVKKVVNGETFSKEVLRGLRWTTHIDNWWKSSSGIASSLSPYFLEGEDRYYSIRKKEVGMENEAVSKNFD